ncbi:tryptophan dimethylallyltransferase-domain-containing protein [Hypoxylon sp. FL0543]|nr:tryptophan dimethylallyltransferase-domain-containing protein [Hypoxylon sp. FL0543]
MAQAIHENDPHSGFYPLQLALDGFSVATRWNELQTRHEGVRRFPCYPAELSVWQQVNSELKTCENIHHRFWWSRHSGRALAVLLHNARYSPDTQYRDLKFFAEVVAPHLGVSHEPGVERGTSPWQSFMTDDGTPVELSWDWGTKDSPPTIRYSIEPIGLHAGTSLDPHNLAVGSEFQNQLLRYLPEMKLELFRHFISFFNGHVDHDVEPKGDEGDHQSSIFYAFDLAPTEITAKVYFFPKMRARAYNQSNLQVILQAIDSIPGVTSENLEACSVFRDFASDVANKNLEYEMLAIDLIDPKKSRLKVYFRSRDTTFNSVINIMTLGGRLRNSRLYLGLVDLHWLWKALFKAYGSLDQPLGDSTHRTAGILYNVEFRLGDSAPVAKIYLPVRHYSSSDAAVIQGLNDYFQYRQRGRYMPDYVKAMSTLFTAGLMKAQSGVQTYVGCAIRPDGTLRLISYFKPQISELFGDEDGT